jgi:hypothetical protein
MPAKSKVSPEEIALSLVSDLTTELHIWAKKSAWPEKVIESMSVQFKDGSLIVDYPEETANEIESLEYGGGSGPYVMPNAVIRPVIYRAANVINDAISNAVINDIADTGGIWA